MYYPLLVPRYSIYVYTPHINRYTDVVVECYIVYMKSVLLAYIEVLQAILVYRIGVL